MQFQFYLNVNWHTMYIKTHSYKISNLVQNWLHMSHVKYCQAQPKSKCSLAELAIKSDSNQQLHNNYTTGEV